MPTSSQSEASLFCARCSTELTPGEGGFFVVRIEAAADPTPPSFSEEDLARDHRGEIDRLAAAAEQLSEQELVDQVYRRLTLHFCGACFREWIENPAG